MKAVLQASVVGRAMPVLDGLAVACAGLLAYAVRWGTLLPTVNYTLVVVMATALVVMLLPLMGAYQSWRGRAHWYHLRHALPGLCLSVLLMALVGTLSKSSAMYSRLWMIYWFVLAVAAMAALRWCLRWCLDKGLLRRPEPSVILLVGDGELASRVAAHVASQGQAGLQIYGVVSSGEPDGYFPESCPIVGDLAALGDLLERCRGKVTEVWLACDTARIERRHGVMSKLRGTPFKVRYVPDLGGFSLFHQVPEEVAGVSVISLNVSPLDGHDALLKAVFDRVFAACALLLCAPVLLLCALAIKLDSRGPVFFVQPRLGCDGRLIQVLKLRSMAQLAGSDSEAPQAVRGDPRVTRVGRFLRRSSLDELPQFWNVLRGDMSVVGPRPHPIALNAHFSECIDAYMQRHRVKPGITGWAQVNGLRGETDTLEKMQKRVDYDLYYIHNWSLMLDIKIILRTALVGWGGRGAY